MFTTLPHVSTHNVDTWNGLACVSVASYIVVANKGLPVSVQKNILSLCNSCFSCVHACLCICEHVCVYVFGMCVVCVCVCVCCVSVLCECVCVVCVLCVLCVLCECVV